MSDMMTFPDTWEEFEKSYGFIDSEEVYTNGSRLIPSFRVEQWLDHIAQFKTKQQAIKASNLIDREDAIANVALEIWHYPNELYTSLNCFENCQELAELALNCLPSAEQERKKGKWIDYSDEGYVECPFCHSATNCDGNKDELHYCFSCGADMREGDSE